jgi:hypothetical protein
MGLGVELAEKLDPTKWQRDVAAYPASTICQTHSWATALSTVLKYKPIFIRVKDDNGSTAGQLLLFVEDEFERAFPPYNALFRFAGRKLGLGRNLVWQYGPLIAKNDRSVEVLRLILRTIDTIARDWNITEIHGTTPPLDTVNEYLVEYNQTCSTLEWGTFIVNTTRDEEILWRALEKTAREDVRRAKKQNMTVKEVTNESLLLDYAALAAKYSNLKRNVLVNAEAVAKAYQVSWRCMQSATDGLYRMFLAVRNNEPKAGLSVYAFNGNATQYNLINDGSPGNPGGSLLTWNVIRWAHSSGMKTLDLTGVNPSPQADDKEKAIYRYKSKWGGTYRTHYHIMRKSSPFRARLLAYSIILQRKLWNVEQNLRSPHLLRF